MTLWQSVRGFFGRKDAIRQTIAFNFLGQPVGTPRQYDRLADEGYQKNFVAYSSIHRIALACAGVNWLLYKKGKGGARAQEITDHSFFDLLNRPNPLQCRAEFIESIVGYKLIAGNSYVNAVGPSPNKILELHPLRPDRVKVVAGQSGYPAAFDYNANGRVVRIPVDVVSGHSPVLHIKCFNPLDDWYGLSPIESAVYAIDQNNQAGKWNLALLQNSAMPSGAFVATASDRNPNAMLSQTSVERLRKQLDENFAGSRNAGR